MAYLNRVFVVFMSILFLGACHNSETHQGSIQTTKSMTQSAPFVMPDFTTALVEVPGGRVETYTYSPEGAGPFPAVYFLQGYPCRTVNPSHEKNQVRNRLVARFVEAGFVVYLAEKNGLGRGESMPRQSCADITYPQEVDAFSAAFSGLRENPAVDAENIFLFGHSLGGQTAPLIALEHDVRGIMTYGIHAKPWFEFMIDLSREQGERLGMDPKQLQSDTALMVPYLYDLMIAKKDWEYLKTTHAKAMKLGIMNGDEERLNGRHYQFWATLNDVNFIEAWAGYKGEVLSIYGTYDIASISPEGAERIVNTVNHYNPGHGEVLILDQTDHGFVNFKGTFEEYKAERFSKEWTGDKTAKMIDPNIADQTIAWMRNKMDN